MDARGFVIRIIAAIMLKRAVLLCIRFQFQKWRRQKHTMEESRRGWASQLLRMMSVLEGYTDFQWDS